MSAHHDLQKVMQEWDKLTNEFRDVSHRASVAEATYRSTRAREIRQLVIGDGMAVTRAEMITDGSEDIEKLLLSRLTTASAVDAIEVRLKWLDNESNRLRSLQVNERAADTLHSQHGPA